jgi:hypothetical protein
MSLLVLMNGSSGPPAPSLLPRLGLLRVGCWLGAWVTWLA